MDFKTMFENKVTTMFGGSAIFAALIGIYKGLKTGNSNLVCVSASALFAGIGHLFAKDANGGPPQPA